MSFDAAGHAWVADGFNDRVLEFFSASITLARVDHFTITRHGRHAVIRWHSTGPIRGFALYQRGRPLTTHLLAPDSQGNCRDEVRWSGLHAYTIMVVLDTGQEVVVAAA